MTRGVFLTEGGSEFFTVFENQPVSLGAQAVNFGANLQTNLALRIRATAASGKDEFAPASTLVALPPGETAETVITYQPERWPAGGWQIVGELFADGQPVDRIAHDLHAWRLKPEPEFLEARDGGFWLRGKPWKAHGVNYMPSSGIGLANWRHFEHWIGRGAYDPEVIERDLRHIKAMNLNSVSVFLYHESLGAQHMLDFLRRCEAHDLKVNLSLRPGTPMKWFTEDGPWRKLVADYRLFLDELLREK